MEVAELFVELGHESAVEVDFVAPVVDALACVGGCFLQVVLQKSIPAQIRQLISNTTNKLTDLCGD